MGNTLQDDMLLDASAVFLNVDEFAETVTFYPAGGGASRSLRVRITHRQVPRDVGDIHYLQEVVSIEVLKDESHVTHGGIEAPTATATSADMLVRAGDTLDEKFVFTGTVLFSDACRWRLEYARSIAKRLGTKHVL